MTRQRLREWLAGTWILYHVVTIIVLLYFSLVAEVRLQLEESTMAASIIGPMVTAYTTLIVRYFNAHSGASTATGGSVNKVYAAIAFLFPALLAAYLNLVIIMYARGSIENPEHFKLMIAFGEGAFGVYAGQLLMGLFEADASPSPAAPGIPKS